MIHLSDDDLIGLVYGIGEGKSHVAGCSDCAARLDMFRDKRAELAPSIAVQADFLAAQRRAIYARMDRPQPSRLKWAPALAAVCLLAIGVYEYRTVPVTHIDSSDAQLFSEVYTMAQSAEPLAAEPIQALFEDNQ
jgi:hypothetical protein